MPRLHQRILFKDTPDDRCSCGIGTETTKHFLLDCLYYKAAREILFATVNPIISSSSPHTDHDLVEILLYGDEKLNPSQNKIILLATGKRAVFCSLLIFVHHQADMLIGLMG